MPKSILPIEFREWSHYKYQYLLVSNVPTNILIPISTPLLWTGIRSICWFWISQNRNWFKLHIFTVTRRFISLWHSLTAPLESTYTEAKFLNLPFVGFNMPSREKLNTDPKKGHLLTYIQLYVDMTWSLGLLNTSPPHFPLNQHPIQNA